MSESSITIKAKFKDLVSATNIETLLNEAISNINANFESGTELFLHDYLQQKNQTMGLDFDSYWLPQIVTRENKVLSIKLIGSPSDSEEQDIITWLKSVGANDISGELVVDAGGDVEVYPLGGNEEGSTVIESELKKRDGAGNTPLHLAAEAGNAMRVQKLIDQGADIEARNKGGGTPLFKPINDDISVERAIECIDVLLRAGADINAKGYGGVTPLGWAGEYGHEEIANYLESRGATGARRENESLYPKPPQ
jgi:hypothetical protein